MRALLWTPQELPSCPGPEGPHWRETGTLVQGWGQSSSFPPTLAACLPPAPRPPPRQASGPGTPHLVRVRAVLVRHNFGLPVTHQVHLQRGQGSGRPPSTTPRGPGPSEGTPRGSTASGHGLAHLRPALPGTQLVGSLTLKWSRSSAVTAYGAPITTSDTYCGDREPRR